MSKLLFVISMSIFSSSAFAVHVKNCPTSIKVTLSEMQVTRSVGYVLREATSGDSESIKAAYQNLVNMSNVEETFPLQKAKSGRCTYHIPRQPGAVEVYSKNGQDRLYVETAPIGPRGILLRAYANIKSLTVEGVTLDESSGSIALAIPRYPYQDYSAGGPLVFVGKASMVAEAN